MVTDKPSVLVIGGGITGLACANYLLRHGRQVTLVDPAEPARAASYGNGGILACCAVVPVLTPGMLKQLPWMALDPRSPLFFRWSRLPFMANWLRHYLMNAKPERVRYIATHLAPLLQDSIAQHQALAKGTAAAKYVVSSPYLFLYKDAAAHANDSFIWQLREQQGYVPVVVENEQLQELIGELNTDGKRGVLLSDHGYIADPGAYIAALRKQLAKAADCKFIQGSADDVHGVGDEVVVMVHGKRLIADKAVICAGAWSGRLATKLGCTVGMESERGYHIELVCSAPPKLPVMDAHRRVGITPMTGRIRLVGLIDLGGLDSPPDQQAMRWLQNIARQMYPNAKQTSDGIWLGNRPATWDSLPLLGQAPACNNIVVAAGLHHVGMTGGPKLGMLAGQLVCGQKPSVPLAAYCLDRVSG